MEINRGSGGRRLKNDPGGVQALIERGTRPRAPALQNRNSVAWGQRMEPGLPNCPQCEARMVPAPRPLNRIFGDVRAFDCPSCGSMIIEYPFELILRANNRKAADAEE